MRVKQVFGPAVSAMVLLSVPALALATFIPTGQVWNVALPQPSTPAAVGEVVSAESPVDLTNWEYTACDVRATSYWTQYSSFMLNKWEYTNQDLIGCVSWTPLPATKPEAPVGPRGGYQGERPDWRSDWSWRWDRHDWRGGQRGGFGGSNWNQQPVFWLSDWGYGGGGRRHGGGGWGNWFWGGSLIDFAWQPMGWGGQSWGGFGNRGWGNWSWGGSFAWQLMGWRDQSWGGFGNRGWGNWSWDRGSMDFGWPWGGSWNRGWDDWAGYWAMPWRWESPWRSDWSHWGRASRGMGRHHRGHERWDDGCYWKWEWHWDRRHECCCRPMSPHQPPPRHPKC